MGRSSQNQNVKMVISIIGGFLVIFAILSYSRSGDEQGQAYWLAVFECEVIQEAGQRAECKRRRRAGQDVSDFVRRFKPKTASNDEDSEEKGKKKEENEKLKEAQKLYLKAKLALVDGRTDVAVGLLESALQVHPKLVKAHLSLIDIYEKRGETDAVKQHCEAAVKINNKLDEAWFKLAQIQLADGNDQLALRTFKTVIGIAPLNAWAHYEYGKLLFKFGQTRASLVAMKRALSIWDIQRMQDPRFLEKNPSIKVTYQETKELVERLQKEVARRP